jgi:hypothetical protein
MSARHKVLCAVLIAAGSLAAGSASATPVTYTMFVVTDVSLNGVHYHNAPVTLTFAGDTAHILPFSETGPGPSGGGSGWKLVTGTASVQVINGTQVISATFAPGQILVALDSQNGGAGFSSMVGTPAHLEPGYPLGLTGTTIGSLPDLVTTGRWSGHAWSCIGYPPVVTKAGRCGNAASFPLSTNRGPFVMYMPYYATNSVGSIVDDYEGALNTATFSVLVGP